MLSADSYLIHEACSPRANPLWKGFLERAILGSIPSGAAGIVHGVTVLEHSADRADRAGMAERKPAKGQHHVSAVSVRVDGAVGADAP